MGCRPLGCLVALPTAVLYGSLSLFVSILHNVFLLYYVDTFVSVYRIDKLSFWIGEVGRRDLLSRSGFEETKGIKSKWTFLCHFFLAFWVSWAHPGLQFLICLCLYDSFLTLVDLNHNALLADLAVSAKERTSLNFYCSLFNAVGSLSVFMSYAFWNKDDFFSFRIFCVLLASCAVIGFTVATWLLRQRFEIEARVKYDDSTLKELYIDQGSNPEDKRITLAEYLKQLSRHRNFLWFVCMNLVQVFHCHFNSNFFPLFLEHLLSNRISLSTGSFLLGISYIAPHLNNLYFLSLCQKYGVYSVVRGLFFLKLAFSLVMLLAGPDQIYLLCIFIASNRVFTEGTCKLLNLVITDLVDEDFVLNHRKQAASALLFGMVALVTKPGQTFAPLIGTWLLCVYTGYDIFQRDPMNNVVSAHPETESSIAWEAILRQGCFYLLVFIPITCALIQLLAWSQFTLRGKRLQLVKNHRQSMSQTRSAQEIKTI